MGQTGLIPSDPSGVGTPSQTHKLVQTTASVFREFGQFGKLQ